MDTVWLYWENRFSDRIPEYLELCLETIQRNAKSVVVVTPETLEEFLPPHTLPRGYHKLAPNHKSDYLRVRLLHDFGGMWADIDTVVFQSLDEHMLNPLREHMVVTIGEKFAQQMFAARKGAPLLVTALEQLDNKIEAAGFLAWNELGAAILYPLAERVDVHPVPMKGWLYGWRDAEKYLEPGEIDYEDRLCCMLYNKQLFPILKDMPGEEILEKDWLLSSMLRKALA